MTTRIRLMDYDINNIRAFENLDTIICKIEAVDLEKSLITDLMDRIGKKRLDLDDVAAILSNYDTKTIANLVLNLAYELTETKKQAEAAKYDRLTGLIQHGDLYSEFKKLYIEECRYVTTNHSNLDLSMLAIDCDGFRQGNTIYGHSKMDQVLVELGRILLNNTRKRDLVSRLGGDEFLVVLSYNTSADQAYKIAGKLLSNIYNHDFGLGDKFSVSIGISGLQITRDDADTICDIMRLDHFGDRKHRLLDKYIKPKFDQARRQSDDALYEAKLRGKGRIECYNPLIDYGQVRKLYNNKSDEPACIDRMVITNSSSRNDLYNIPVV